MRKREMRAAVRLWDGDIVGRFGECYATQGERNGGVRCSECGDQAGSICLDEYLRRDS